MPAGSVMNEGLARIRRQAVEPLDRHYGRRKLIIIGDGEEGWWRRVAQVVASIQVGIPGEQDQGLHLRMAAGSLNGVIDPATGATHADHVARNTRLRHQILESNVDVARPLRPFSLRAFRRNLVDRVATTLSKAAEVQREDVDSRGRELPGQAVPNLALAVALVQEKDSRTRIGGSKICGLEFGTVGGGQVHDALG